MDCFQNDHSGLSLVCHRGSGTQFCIHTEEGLVHRISEVPFRNYSSVAPKWSEICMGEERPLQMCAKEKENENVSFTY